MYRLSSYVPSRDRGRGTALTILDSGARGGWVVSVTLRLLCLQEERPDTDCMGG